MKFAGLNISPYDFVICSLFTVFMFLGSSSVILDDFYILDDSIPNSEQLQHSRGLAKILQDKGYASKTYHIELYILANNKLRYYDCALFDCETELKPLHHKPVTFSHYGRTIWALTVEDKPIFTYQEKVQQFQQRQEQAKTNLIIWFFGTMLFCILSLKLVYKLAGF